MAFFIKKWIRPLSKTKLNVRKFSEITNSSFQKSLQKSVNINPKIAVSKNIKNTQNQIICLKYSTRKHNENQLHPEIENALNQQITTEFNASFTYLSMSAFFGRTEIALPGCQGFFYDMYQEEAKHAIIFINYQLMRGGHVVLCPFDQPPKDWINITNTFEASLQMEKDVKEKICQIIKQAEKHCDYQLVDFLSSQYLREQNESIQKMARLLTRASKMTNEPNGEFLFDKQLFKNYVKDENEMFCKKVPDIDDKYYK